MASIRKPVRRQRADHYLLLTLISFAISVSATRLFLELTGYPQLGNSELHIAHVLWGGLLLFIAALTPIVYANRWAFTLEAILSGVGVGLFIDEVGKFITQNNNYFYPSAAPIIYAFFLLTVLLYTRIKRQAPNDPRSEFYAVLSDLEEILDRDLDANEQADLVQHLEDIAGRADTPDLRRLAVELRDFVAAGGIHLVPDAPGFWEKWGQRLSQWEARRISRGYLRAILAGGLAAIGAWSVYTPLRIFILQRDPLQMQQMLEKLVNAGLVRSSVSLNVFVARLGLELAVGVILLAGAILLASGRDHQGVALGYAGLLVSLTMVNLLVFYFDQFSSIINATVQLGALLGLLHYRRRYFAHARR